MNRREMFIRSGLGLVALSTLPALASIKSNQRNSYNIYNDKNVGKDRTLKFFKKSFHACEGS